MIGGAIAGLTAGGAYALLGVCLVLMYRMTGVVNFAAAAIGAMGMYVSVRLDAAGLPYVLAALIGVIASAILGALCGAVMTRWFAEASVERRSTVAIAMLIGLIALGTRLFGSSPQVLPEQLQGAVLTVGGTVITQAAVVAIASAVGLAVAVHLVLVKTTLGLRLRALSERPTTSELHGIPVPRLAIGVWAATGAAASVCLLIVAPTRPAGFTDLSLLVILGLAAALIGLFRSLVATVIGGIALGVLDGITNDIPVLYDYREAVPLVVVLITLLWTQRKAVWDAAR
ncbi:MAG TPA: branched-chain amino acid ABC transporter permease [Microbacterium sp.]|uniref:branched-chain amino acid ABC transporter permease n=1 Tax=Microbacterium sp. TaxID=51671 RepID=UPI002B48D00E|nr:branched-chain amino acid ABC transporter permease [Microbacterium sp.]HKT58174.1 branched-chain amino acid ABC transporter permease [Microbacterium sp.]